ncbi:hypothetical protein D1646_15190 [Pseudoflavonifractor sp. 60]|nr:hypothetical protein [Pseudoflavonifractor sp. 60]
MIILYSQQFMITQILLSKLVRLLPVNLVAVMEIGAGFKLYLAVLSIHDLHLKLPQWGKRFICMVVNQVGQLEL